MKPQPTAGCGRTTRRGSVLIYSVFLLTLAAIAVTGVVALVWTHLRGAGRAEGRLRAFYAAEAGVQQVIDWFNRGYYTWFEGVYGSRYPDVPFHTWEDARFPDGTFQGYFHPFTDIPDSGFFVNSEGTSSFLYEDSSRDRIEISKRPDRQQSPLWWSYLPSLADSQANLSMGYVEELRMIRPAPRSNRVCHVVSVGRDPSTGVVATVEVDLMAPWMSLAFAPAALLSRSTATSGGLFQVRWGEVWAAGNLDLTNPISQKFLDAMKDPWFHGRSESMVIGKDAVDPAKIWYADGLSEHGFASVPVDPSSPNYYQPYKVLLPKNNHLRGYEGSFYQHQTLQWPDYEYQMVKAYCLRHGYPVYRTTEDGTLIVGTDPTGNPILKTFEEVFNVAATLDPDSIDREVMPPLYFIDTTDGTPPKTDGSNVPTIRIAGNGPFFYGYFFLAANIFFGGAGNSPSLDSPERPDRTISRTPIQNCRLAGLFYTYGQAEFQGEGDVYGTLYAKNGFWGGGNWSIYYDWRLGDPLRDRTGSRVEVGLWDTYYGYPGF